MSRKSIVQIVISLAVIALAIFWAFDSTRTQPYTGMDLSVRLGSGTVNVTNPGEETLVAELRSMGTRGTFAIASNNLDLTATSEREGTGSQSVNTMVVDLPPGVTDITLTRGVNAGVILSITGDQAVDIVQEAMTADEARTTWIVAGIVILGSLYFLSNATGHRWLGWVKQRLSASRTRGIDPEQLPT